MERIGFFSDFENRLFLLNLSSKLSYEVKIWDVNLRAAVDVLVERFNFSRPIVPPQSLEKVVFQIVFRVSPHRIESGG